jgi:hypothetical protein
MQTSRTVAIISVFTALIISSNFALASIPNVKLMDTIVFTSAFLFGFRSGAYIAILSALIWGVVSPWGFGGYIIPFLVFGELVYALAGWWASKVWGSEVSRLSIRNFYLGAVIAISTFIWDFETNVGTAIIAFWPQITIEKILATQLFGSLFMFFHVSSNFLLGSFLAPLLIFYLTRTLSPRQFQKIEFRKVSA